ncbi:hypothetical protein ACFY00_36845 [Kitasatospora sp. NPDC001540]|uniref:hypothetical protein n=1 Tax=Kitasatospora sp. NPDC001540 TaxID=3364014 RepID=UPI00369EF683
MSLTPSQRIEKFSRWTKPPTLAEEARLDRAKRMVTNAVKQHPPFAGLGLVVEPKGSWANNTNVSSDSDMDIKVEFTRRSFRGAVTGMGFVDLYLQNNEYSGRWTPEEFRSELGIALKTVSTNVDSSHNVAFYVPSVPGSRPDTDVVPCFTYFSRPTTLFGVDQQGTVVFTKDGKHIVNWSQQQLVNGREKNNDTGRRYKYVVRVLKAVENELSAMGVIKDLPSYFMECLIYNVPNDVLRTGTFDDAFRGALIHLGVQFNPWSWQARPDDMVEPNGIKKLFGSGQKWTKDDGRKLVAAAWDYLGYGS